MARREFTPANALAQLLDRHFLACAAGAAAAAAGTTESAQAEVQYSGLRDLVVPHTTSTGVYINFDNLMAGFPGASFPGWDVNLFNSANLTTGRRSVLMYVPDTTNNTAVGQNLPTYAYLSRLGSGVAVGPGSNFVNLPTGYPYGILAYRSGAGQYDQSLWNGGVTDGFVGVRFTGADNMTHFGWVRLNIDPFSSPTPYRITLRDFAWETTPDTAIETGAGIPEPTTAAIALGLLALGAAGIRPRRN